MSPSSVSLNVPKVAEVSVATFSWKQRRNLVGEVYFLPPRQRMVCMRFNPPSPEAPMPEERPRAPSGRAVPGNALSTNV